MCQSTASKYSSTGVPVGISANNEADIYSLLWAIVLPNRFIQPWSHPYSLVRKFSREIISDLKKNKEKVHLIIRDSQFTYSMYIFIHTCVHMYLQYSLCLLIIHKSLHLSQFLWLFFNPLVFIDVLLFVHHYYVLSVRHNVILLHYMFIFQRWLFLNAICHDESANTATGTHG